MHPFLLLVCFNAFAEGVHPWLETTATWWGVILQWSSPGFIVMEGMSSLLVAQRLGQVGKELVDEGEGYQFGLLVGAAAAYVVSAWWVVVVSDPSHCGLLRGPERLDLTFGSVRKVLPRCGRFPALFNAAWSGVNHSDIPNVHWIRASSYERDRDELHGSDCRVQRMAVWRGRRISA